MALTTKKINDLNKMNRAAQNSSLGTLLSGIETNSSGSYSGSSVYNSLVAHTSKSGSDVHGLGNISVQSASSVNITGGTISSGVTLTSLNTHTGKSGSDVHNLGTISIQSASAINVTGGNISGVNFAKTNVSASSLTYTVLETDFTVRCNATSGSIGIFLRPATSSGRIHNIKNLYTSACLVVVYGDTTGTPDLIDGESSQTLPVKTNMTIQDNAVNFWDIL